MFNHVSFMVFVCFPFLMVSCVSPTKQETEIKAQEGDLSLIINVTGLRCCEGTLLLAVYNDKNYWMKRVGMARGQVSVNKRNIKVMGLN